VALASGYIPARPQGSTVLVVVDGRQQSVQGLAVLPGFANMLGLRAIRGDLRSALELPDNFVISEAAALRLFGTADALGRTLQVEGKLVRVGAVLETPPSNTTIPFEALVGVNSIVMDNGFREELLTGAQGWWGKLLVRVRPGASLSAIEAALQQAVDSNPLLQNRAQEVRQRLGKRKAMEITLAPLRYAYFDQDVAANYVAPAGERGHPAVVAGLGLVAILILALAAINYVNLATVGVLRRQREVAMRKVLGARMGQIVLQMVAESMLVTMTATVLGLLLAWLALPLFSTLINRQLDSLLSASHIAAALALGAMLGAVTAVYPTWIALRVRPNAVLAGRADSESQGGLQLRRVMTVLQLATAMGFAGFTLAIIWQTNYALNASPGFDPAPLLIADLLDDDKDRGRMPGLVAALSAQPGIVGVARSQDAVGRHNGTWQRDLKRDGGANATVEMKWVSVNYFEQYGLKPLAGRLFDTHLDKEGDPLPLVLNAGATRQLGFATPADAVGQTVFFTENDGKKISKRVVGIAPDLRFQSLREAPHAMAYELPADLGHTLSVRFTGSAADAERTVRTLWARHFPDALIALRSASDILTDDYAEDVRIAKLLTIATGIALAIAAFGTYVLSAHTVQRRAREIVLRKLHGAGRIDVGLLVAREIGGLALVSAAAGLPIAAIAIARYLASYVEHAPVGYWTLLAALASTLAVALLAVARNAWIAMRMHPAEALRVG
jgi:putative ABC transport system permease protein